ncbi:hypothetical protein EV177_002522 [Coemansia sp. RSA 1804]|nr:hypothetical protein EV177_002522 [Coemansia sp. RSA 1804]
MTQTAAIIGATGLQGGSVLRALHTAGKYKLVAVTRDASSEPAKEIKAKYPNIRLAEGDLNQVESLKKAFEGADFVFGVTMLAQPGTHDGVIVDSVSAEYKQGKNITDAAIAAGVKSIVISTIYSLNELSGGRYPEPTYFKGKLGSEKYLRSKAAEIRGAFIHIGSYMENFVSFSRISPDDNKTIEFLFPLPPATKLPLVDAATDTGGVVAYMVEHFDDFVGKSVEVSGGYYEAQEMAVAFTEATGRPAKYVQLPYEALNNKDMELIFRSFDEIGYFGYKTDFLEINEKMDYKHTTPAEFWKNRGWTGPSQ